MSVLEWNDDLKVGHSLIDGNHMKLVVLINELGGAMSAGRGRDVCGKVLDELMSLTDTHFALEEQLMNTHCYAESSEHRTEHARLAKNVAELKGKHEAGMLTIAVFLLHFLMEWLTHHSLKADKALAQGIPDG